ncbi:MAG TPA: hypothetical protein VKR06_32790, partial [Ktedonosporobacter sp.]|nr:hypothetical protein [Ktedonosporobacter sp.]
GLARTVTGVLLLFFSLRYLAGKYALGLLGFTSRFLLALTLAALPSILWHPGERILAQICQQCTIAQLPGILWHPDERILLVISSCLFLLLCLGLLLLLKPFSADDLTMIGSLNARLAKYVRWFARKPQDHPRQA